MSPKQCGTKFTFDCFVASLGKLVEDDNDLDTGAIEICF